ncbi:Gfo/Idh/MocA family oxidoreductase [Fulvivirga kasyanovii]|uniref:Gfo/Idh/MocA family oxidoreductase n=1 Tax=Fulvivirga kasyanovii TaxID=396812 RepID=A0ABW9RPV1_9BACT|nr:Gfo/Idh/MocA family oxidoreductase [Fulvivirga kasyanovii]MTI25971.1 Gfo/Idh/MocA family oxidoreductase [Fulvivirga kasyanovii]
MKGANNTRFYNRRTFIRHSALFGTVGLLTPGLLASACGNKTGRDMDQSYKEGKKLGIALVGLGRYSSGQLAPALQETQYCYLSGIVTGSPEKEPKWMKKYNIPKKNVYNYDNFDSIAENPDIDIIYIVLPNGMHAEYTIRAAKAGKHVICEKPMATSVADAEAMIRACAENNVMLSLGYRLHFEPHHLRVMQLGQKKVFGPVESIKGIDNMVINNWEWRLDKELAGGGPLMDLGIYTIQGACYTMGEWPVEVVEANYGKVTKPELFKEVEQSITFTLKFPNGTQSTHTTSYADQGNLLEASARDGWWKLSPAYSYSGINGETSEGPMDIQNVNQQARQMDYFAQCVMDNKPILVPGDMGLRDVKIMMAVYEAADSGKSVKLDLSGLDIPKYDIHARHNEALETSMK